jgi:hypothetical protein
MAMSHLSRFLAQPSSKHREAVKRVLRYLKSTIDIGLVLSGQDSCTLTDIVTQIGPVILRLDALALVMSS